MSEENKYEKLFDPKFVRFMWDDELEGKEVFTADDMETLIKAVNNNNSRHIVSHTISNSNTSEYDLQKPFRSDTMTVHQFAYYDPNYDIKRAYIDGKQMQYRLKGTVEWYNVFEEYINERDLIFFDDNSSHYEFHVKPITRDNDPDDCHGCEYDEDNMYMCTRCYDRECYKPKEDKVYSVHKNGDYCVIYEGTDARQGLSLVFTGTKGECEHWIAVERNCKRCLYEDSPCTLADYGRTDSKCDNFCPKEQYSVVETVGHGYEVVDADSELARHCKQFTGTKEECRKWIDGHEAEAKKCCVFLNMNCDYEIIKYPMKTAEFCGTREEYQKWIDEHKQTPDKRMTYRQLAKYVKDNSKEFRECLKGNGIVRSNVDYPLEDENKECDEYIKVRSNSGEWQDPTVDLLDEER